MDTSIWGTPTSVLSLSEIIGSTMMRPPLVVSEYYEHRLRVLGDPAPAGSKIPFRKGNGALGVRDACKASRPWKTKIQNAATMLVGPHNEAAKLSGPLCLELVFYKTRPKSHFGTGKNSKLLKQSAPEYPITRPDALKLARAVEDALTGLFYHDDAQIVDEKISKRFGDQACVEIHVTRIDQGEVD